MAAIFQITDGTSTIDLLNIANGYAQTGWRQAIAQYKGGGTWQSSSLSDGRRLVNRNFENIRQEISLTIQGQDQDAFARAYQDLARLLEKAADYWATDWQNDPVWLVSKADCETNTRYAYVHFGTIPELANVYPDQSTRKLFIEGKATMEGLALVLEHGHWQADEPGTDTCVQTSGLQVGIDTQTEFSVSVSQSTDDGGYFLGGVSFSLTGANLYLGYAVATDSWFSFLRFQNVNVPQGATIRNAYITFECSINTGNGRVIIQGEDADNPATFSDYSNVVGRTRTTATVEWPQADFNGVGLGTWVAGTTYDTPDLSRIVQEIVDRAGWVANNSMVFFFDDVGGAAAAYNAFASWDDPARAAPELNIVYDATETQLGRSATCNDEVYVANQHKTAQLTDAYHYDQSGGVWSANLMGAALPFALLPNPVANQDSLFLGIDTDLPDSGPFCSAVFDIAAAAVFGGNAVIDWYYWNGAWQVLTIEDKTADATGLSFNQTGVGSVHWAQPSDWAIGNLNTIFGGGAPNVNGYWVRAQANIAAPPGDSITTPTQQNRHIYTISWSGVDIAAAQIGGDIPAIARVHLHNVSDGNAYGGAGPSLWAQRVIMALRSYDRGANFRPYINLAGEQNPPGVTTGAGGVETSFTTDTTTAAGRRVTYNPVASLALSIRCGINFSGAVAKEYEGRYRMFLRARQQGGDLTTNYISVQIRIEVMADTLYTSNILRFSYANDWQPLDFGEIDFPPTGSIAADEAFDYGISINVYASASTNVPDLYVYDLVLMPCDEYIVDTVDPTSTTSGGTALRLGKLYESEAERYLTIDGTKLPKQPIRSILHREDNDGIKGAWLPIGDRPILQANKRQKLWFMTFRATPSGGTPTNEKRSEPWVAHSVQLWSIERYFAMRGNR